jgi:hypothetical protein
MIRSLAMLDSNFRIGGTKGLRVVDGSAFPRTPEDFPVIPSLGKGVKISVQHSLHGNRIEELVLPIFPS